MPKQSHGLHEVSFEIASIANAGVVQYGFNIADVAGVKSDPDSLIRIHRIDLDDQGSTARAVGALQAPAVLGITQWIANRALSAAEYPGNNTVTGVSCANSAVVDSRIMHYVTNGNGTEAATGAVGNAGFMVTPFSWFLGWKGSGQLCLSDRFVYGLRNNTGVELGYGGSGGTGRIGLRIYYSLEKMTKADLDAIRAALQQAPVFAAPQP